MNNIFKTIIFGAALTLGLSSCNDFFEESSQDEIKPTTTEDLGAVLYSKGYPYNFSSDAYLLLLTDEVQSNGCKNDNYKDRMRAGQYVFCFDNEMFDGVKTFSDDENSWKNWYSLIMGCNVVMDNADAMTGSDADKKALKGQARLLRAYYYMRLAMVYCQPYRINPEQNLGVTLITSSDVKDAEPARATVKETYDFIESELITAATELKDYTPSTVYRVTKICADMLLARLYLYEENWEKAAEYATISIKEGPALTNMNSLVGSNYNICEKSGSSEVVWNYAGKTYATTYFGFTQAYYGVVPYSLSDKVLQLYDATNDIRYKKFFQISSWQGSYCLKTYYGSQYDGEHTLRMAEPYLIRAEAYARLNKATEALADLNAVRENRYTTGTYTALTSEDVAGNLLQTVLDERQREFVWEEGLRWMDIKRLGLSITHTFIDEEGNSTDYTLKSNDLLYALPIPQDAITRNKNLVQNPR